MNELDARHDATKLRQAVGLLLGAAGTALLVAGPLGVDFIEANQLLQVQPLYGLRFIGMPLYWAFFFRRRLVAKFGEVLEALNPPGRILASGFVASLLLFAVGIVMMQWPTPRRGVPTAETTGIVARPSPSLFLPSELAGIKPTVRTEDAPLDAAPGTPTTLPPQGETSSVEAVQSSLIEPAADLPANDPPSQSQAVATNEVPPRTGPPSPPANLRLVGAGQ